LDPYSIIAQYPNAGQGFSNAFNQGMQQNALAAFAQNPNDPRAQAAASRYDPSAVMQYRQQEMQLSHEQTQQWHAYAGELAKWADNPQKWDEAVDYMVSQGHPEAAQLKGKFSPALRQSFMALGGVKDDNPVQDPGIIREFDIATQRGLVPQGTTYEQYVRMRNPGMSAPVTIPYGATVSGGGDMPTVASPQDAMKLPPGTQFRMPDGRIGTVPGGAGGNASGGFPQ
jgi:hypothetical protein